MRMITTAAARLVGAFPPARGVRRTRRRVVERHPSIRNGPLKKLAEQAGCCELVSAHSRNSEIFRDSLRRRHATIAAHPVAVRFRSSIIIHISEFLAANQGIALMLAGSHAHHQLEGVCKPHTTELSRATLASPTALPPIAQGSRAEAILGFIPPCQWPARPYVASPRRARGTWRTPARPGS